MASPVVGGDDSTRRRSRRLAIVAETLDKKIKEVVGGDDSTRRRSRRLAIVAETSEIKEIDRDFVVATERAMNNRCVVERFEYQPPAKMAKPTDDNVEDDDDDVVSPEKKPQGEAVQHSGNNTKHNQVVITYLKNELEESHKETEIILDRVDEREQEVKALRDELRIRDQQIAILKQTNAADVKELKRQYGAKLLSDMGQFRKVVQNERNVIDDGGKKVTTTKMGRDAECRSTTSSHFQHHHLSENQKYALFKLHVTSDTTKISSVGLLGDGKNNGK